MGCIINSKFLRCSAIGALFFSNYACALGFGEITLHSRIGEPLRAEVALHGSDNQEVETACYSLTPLRGSDLPVVTNARTRLVRAGQDFRLLITGGQPISEPVFMIGLRASCGVDLQRDYVLMPAAPLALSENPRQPSIAAVDLASRKKTGSTREWPAHDGDTMESIAESQAPGSIIEQRRLLAAMQRANPGLQPEQILTEGTAVRIPNLAQRITAEQPLDPEAQVLPPRPQSKERPPAPRAKKPVRRDTLAELDIKGADRVMLGAEPEALKPGELAVAQRNEVSDMDGRMLKMETSLRSLNLQVENLNTAVEVTAEAMALRQKLQAAQAQLAQDKAEPTIKPAGNSAAIPATTAQATDNSRTGNWLELLFSALAGGLIAGAIAHLLGKRQAVQPIDNGQVINLSAARRKKPSKV